MRGGDDQSRFDKRASTVLTTKDVVRGRGGIDYCDETRDGANLVTDAGKVARRRTADNEDDQAQD